MNIVGKQYGKLTVLEATSERRHKAIVWLCLCECGNQTRVTTNALNTGKTKSCGCSRTPLKLPAGDAGLRELYRSYYRDAKRRSLPFELDLEEFRNLVIQPCYFCGAVECQTKYSRGKTTNRGYQQSAFKYTGIDRLDNSYGYTLTNSKPCCNTCNIAKRCQTEAEFEEWIGRVYATVQARKASDSDEGGLRDV